MVRVLCVYNNIIYISDNGHGGQWPYCVQSRFIADMKKVEFLPWTDF